MQKKRKKYVKKAKFRPGLTKMLPLIPNYPEWITSGSLAKKLNITTDRAISWINGIPEETPIAVDDISKGVQKYCYIVDGNGKILI
jgi:hypothetical protein